MLPWEKIDTAHTPSGEALVLYKRGTEYVIRTGGTDLMGNRSHGSEEALADLGCAHLLQKPKGRILIGGLGMCFTLAATLKIVPKDASVEVAELVPEIETWNRKYFGEVSNNALRDPRTHLSIGDVRDVILAQKKPLDAILLDVDNGPAALSTGSNKTLYGTRGVAVMRDHLAPGGVLAVWSATDSAAFTKNLQNTGFEVKLHPVKSRGRSGIRHWIWIATRKA